jgi:hypothetical protein
MGAPHNRARYGEIWPQHRIDACLTELEAIRPWVVVSGGWAWHFMSPKGHVELKHAHDHKDIDVFVVPHDVAQAVSTLQDRGFTKTWTKYDRLPSDESFRRYEKSVESVGEKPVRVTVDFFVRDNVPCREIDGWRVVEPRYLLGLYSNIHSSDKCFAVQAAAKLLDRGIDPVGRTELVQIPSN